MAERWVLTDHAAGVWVESLELGPEQLGIAGCRVSKRRLRGGLSDGVDVVEVSCGELRCTIVPTRGMGLWRGNYRGMALGWRSPVRGPVHPAHVEAGDRGGLGWLRGFDEWVVRCGLDSNGAPGTDTVIDNNGNRASVQLGLHGKIANLPAHLVVVSADPATETVTVSGAVDESALFHPLLRLETTTSLTAGSPRITVSDTVTNLQATPAELELLYHCNFGPPFLGAGSRLLVPFEAVAPRDARAVEAFADVAGSGAEADQQRLQAITGYLGPTAGYVEQVYFYWPAARGGDGATLAALATADGERAAVVRFDARQLPCLSVWKNTAAESDGYVTGIEPATNYPNLKSVERKAGRVIELQPAASHHAQLMFEVADGVEQVAAVRDEVADIQRQASGTVHATPHADYGADG